MTISGHTEMHIWAILEKFGSQKEAQTVDTLLNNCLGSQVLKH